MFLLPFPPPPAKHASPIVPHRFRYYRMLCCNILTPPLSAWLQLAGFPEETRGESHRQSRFRMEDRVSGLLGMWTSWLPGTGRMVRCGLPYTYAAVAMQMVPWYLGMYIWSTWEFCRVTHHDPETGRIHRNGNKSVEKEGFLWILWAINKNRGEYLGQ